jgi:dCMP deaminase
MARKSSLAKSLVSPKNFWARLDRENKKMKQAIFAFVPAIHRGYIDFFSKNDGDIWIFGDDIINQYVHLTRDVRTIDPDQAAQALHSISPGRKVHVAHIDDLKAWKYKTVLMPDDEVCRDIAEKYLTHMDVKFISVFLRWNRMNTFKENEIQPHRKISHDQFHKEILDKAFQEASKSSDWWRQIGAIVMKDGKILFSTHNHHLPTDFHLSVNGDPRSNFDMGQHQEVFTSIHSEAEAIARAAREGISLKDSTFYVTTFPCPNCARLIGTAGVKTLYYSKGYSLLDAEKILAHFEVEIILVQ